MQLQWADEPERRNQSTTTTLTHSGLDEIVLDADIPIEHMKGANAQKCALTPSGVPNRFRGTKKRLADRQAAKKRRAHRQWARE